MIEKKLAQTPRLNLVLLGASNLTMGLKTVTKIAGKVLGSPLNYYVASGHGRSYGQTSSVFFRRLPGIRSCGLWKGLSNRENNAPVLALITDIGNDLLYQASIAEITDWLRYAFDQLSANGASIVVSQIPLDNVLSITNWQFRAIKYVLFPGRKIYKDQMIQNAFLLADVIKNLVREYDGRLLDLKPQWYGFDPIHYRMSCLDEVWEHLLSGWGKIESRGGFNQQLSNQSAFLKNTKFLSLNFLGPELRWIAGIECRRRQPSVVLADGSIMHLY